MVKPRSKDTTLYEFHQHGCFALRTGALRAAVVALLACCATMLTTPVAAPAAPVGSPLQTWQPNGPVSRVVQSSDGTRAFIGGDFSYVGPDTGSAVRVNDDGLPTNGAWPSFTDGSVEDIVDDGVGGWFVAGSFLEVDGVSHPYLVHVTSAGLLDPTWAPAGVDADVAAIARNGTRLYVAGAFAGLHQVRALTVASGSLDTSFGGAGSIAATGNAIETLLSTPARLYVGGDFGSIGGTGGGRLAALTHAGTVDGVFTVGPVNGRVSSLAIDGPRLYVGGAFTNINGTGRSRVAAVDIATGTLDAGFDPGTGASAAVEALAVNPATTSVYAGGSFGLFNGSTRNRIVKLDASTGALDAAFAPSFNGTVLSIEPTPDGLLVGGTFTTLDSQARLRSARLDALTGTLDPGWSVHADEAVQVQRSTATGVVLGGIFTSFGGVARSNLAAIDLATGEATSWAPNVGFNVSAIAEHAGIVYVGGSGPGAVSAFRAGSGVLQTGFPIVVTGGSATVRDLLVVGNVLVVAGSFDSLGGSTHRGIGGLGLDGSVLATWPAAGVGSNTVYDIERVGSDIVIGGSFSEYNSVPSNRVARLDPVTAGRYGWNPNVVGTVRSISVDGGRAHVAGAITAINGTPVTGAAAIDLVGSGGTPTPVPSIVGSGVDAIQVRGAEAYIGGPFTMIGGTPRPGLGGYDTSAGAALAWNPQPARPTGVVSTIDADGSTVIVGGMNGIAVYRTMNDTLNPYVGLSRIDEVAAGIDPNDGTFVQSPSTVFVRTSGPVLHPSFTVHVDSYDPFTSGQDTYADASGIEHLQWGDVGAARGTWTPGASRQFGAPRGLKTTCWKNLDPGSGPIIGTAIDRSIDYDQALHRPDVLPALPATIAAGAGFDYDDGTDGSTSFQWLSCRWQGFVIPTDSAAPSTYQFRAVADNGMRVNVDDQGGLGAPWQTVNYWLPTGTSPASDPVVFAAGQARPLTVEWWEQNGDSAAVLEWDDKTSGATWSTVPEAAFVTRVDYKREFRFTGGTATDGSSPVQVTARDQAGNTATDTFSVITDDAAPTPSTFTSTEGAWSDGSVDVHIVDGDDTGSGIYERRLERRFVPFEPGTGNCDLADAGIGTWLPAGAPLPGGPTTRDITLGPYGHGCTQLRLVTVDQVGNEQIDGLNGDDALVDWIRVDLTPANATGASITYADGWTNQTNVPVLFTPPTDPESGIAPAAIRVERSIGTLSGNLCDGWGIFSDAAGMNPVSPYAGAVPDGFCYQFRLVYANGMGTPGTITSSAVVMADATDPNAALDATALPTGGMIPLQVSFNDPDPATSALASYAVTFTGPGHPTPSAICNSVPTLNTSYVCNWDTSGLTDGVYTLAMSVDDIAGNSTDITPVDKTVDNTAPTFSRSFSGLGSSAALDLGDPGLLWINTDTSGVVVLDSGAADPGSGLLTTVFSAPAAGWTITNPTASSSQLTWSSGAGDPGPISLVATDAYGNFDTLDFDVQRDNDPPTGTVITQTTGIGSVPTINASVGVDAGAGIDRFEILRQQTTRTGGVCDAWVDPPAVMSGATTGSWMDPSVAADRCYRYSIRVYDRVGNERTVAATGEFMTDAAGIEIVPAAAGVTAVTEGTSIAYLVRLRAAPSSDVTIDLTGDGQVQAAPAQLVFTTSNWSQQQAVTVVGSNDQVDEPSPMNANVTYAIAPATVDPDYSLLASVTSTVSVIDDDVAAVKLGPGASNVIAVAESGATSATYSMRLATRPVGAVTITPTTGAQITVSPTSLTFDATNWSTPRSFTVTAVDDALVEGDHGASITHAVTAPDAGDAAYAALAPIAVPVQIADDDVAELVVQAPADGMLDEADPSATRQVFVRLQAKPSAPVTVAATAAAGQLVAEPASLTFTPGSWSTAQAVTVRAAADTVAEPNPHVARLQLTTTSGSPEWSAIPMRVVELGVRDDDPAAFVVSPGPRWTLDDDGRLQLDETATQAAIVRIRTAGDPTADVTITPRATATGQLEVSPASVTIPAGSHEQVVSFSVRAVNDREDEAATHAAKIEWKVASGDVLYAGATMPNTFARIKDAGSVSLRGETDKVDPVAPDPRPTSTGPAYSGPEPASPDPVDPSREARDGDKPPGEIVGDDESDPVDDGSGDDDSSRERSSTAPKNDADTKRDESLAGKPVKRLKHWAGEHKAKAAVGVSAAGTAAIWAFKPLALAGKALGTGGGGLPHPPGMTQLRHLFKRRNLRRIKNNARRLHRRGKGRPFDDDEDDWDDFLWGDRAA